MTNQPTTHSNEPTTYVARIGIAELQARREDTARKLALRDGEPTTYNPVLLNCEFLAADEDRARRPVIVRPVIEFSDESAFEWEDDATSRFTARQVSFAQDAVAAANQAYADAPCGSAAEREALVAYTDAMTALDVLRASGFNTSVEQDAKAAVEQGQKLTGRQVRCGSVVVTVERSNGYVLSGHSGYLGWCSVDLRLSAAMLLPA